GERGARRVRDEGCARPVRVRRGAVGDERPGAAAVRRQGERARRRGGAGEVAADREALQAVPERDGEDAGAVAARDGRLRHLPVVAAVRRAEDAPARRAAAAEPGVVPARGRDALVRGGEPELVGRVRLRHVASRVHVPAAAAVRGDQDAEAPVDRVAQDEPVAAVEERHAVVEGLRVRVAVRHPPVAAAVRCQVGAEVAGWSPIDMSTAWRASNAFMPRNSSALVPSGPTSFHERPPLVVRSTVPPLPLAQTTRRETGLIARRSALPPWWTTCQEGAWWAVAAAGVPVSAVSASTAAAPKRPLVGSLRIGEI